MTPNEKARPLATVGLEETSFCRCVNPENNRQQSRLSSADHAQSRARLKFLACRLHELGEKPLFHFLDEVERGANLRCHLERYAALPANFIRAYGGDRFAPSLHCIDGGQP